MQTRVLDANLDVVFAATVDVLQEVGWELNLADKASGILRASTDRRLEKLSPKEEHITDFNLRKKKVQQRQSDLNQWTRWEGVTVHIEPWGGKTRQRMVITRYGTLPAMSYETRVDRSWFGRSRKAMIHPPAREESEELGLPEVYADYFDRIEKAVKARSQP